jgi:acetyl-CoA C-acetyltransferase
LEQPPRRHGRREGWSILPDDVDQPGLGDRCICGDERRADRARGREDGTVTAGNACGITDGAAAVLLASESEARKRGLTVHAWVGPGTTAGVDPSIMGIGPVPAVRQLLAESKRTLDDYDLVELNEAFAAQVLACDRELGFDRARLNVNGGAIALGHPIGCTGARIVTTLLHEMERRDARLGLATLCVSGGLGLALELERDGARGSARGAATAA